MKAILTLTIKDLHLLLRDRMGFFVTFVFPVVYAIFFGVIFGARGLGSQPVTVTVIDDSQNEASAQYIYALSKSQRLDVHLADNLTGESCLNSGECDVLIRIPKSFALQSVESSLADIAHYPNVTAEFSSTLSADLSVVGLDVLVTRSPDSTTTASPKNGSADSRTDASVQRAHAYELSFPIGIAWGVLGCAASFGLSLVIERTRGTLFRLRTAPIGQLQVVLGKAGACFVCSSAMGVLLILIGRIAFDVHPTSYGLLAIGMASVSFAFAGIMVLLSVIGKTERVASGISWSILLAMTMLGGGMVPHFFMPGWLQHLASASPVRWAILALEGAIWRNFTLTQMIPSCSILLGIGFVGMIAGSLLFRWTQHD